jgi:dolichol-phosphate mannosyltransferase
LAGTAWLILPTFNEAENLEAVVDAARTTLLVAAPAGFRVLVVDDSSPDGTGAIADAIAGRHDDVEVLHRPRREGLGPAYIAGFDRALAADASEVLEMDADLSHDPADLARLLAAVREQGADVALGSRYVEGGGVNEWSALRRAVSRAGSWYARAVLRIGVVDPTGGFKCFRADVLRAIDLPSVRSRGYSFQVELTYRALVCGFRVVELPIVFRNRTRGKSKMSPRIALEAALLVPQLRSGAKHLQHPAEDAQAPRRKGRSDGR